jgi:MFS transporter, putative metabolite:H+ symporter
MPHSARADMALNVRGRLDRLPFTSIHRLTVAALAFAYFFELGDLNTFAFAAPALIKQWHISVTVIATITSMSFGGMFLGATLGGWVADKIGRKPALIYSVALYTLFSLLNACAWDVLSLGLIRLVTGIGLSATTIIANAYISEFFPTRSRGRYMAIVFTVGLIGIPVTAWVARFLVPLAPWGWRLVFLWGALGVGALLLMTRMVESPRWLQAQGRGSEADAVLVRLEQQAVIECGELRPLTTPDGATPVGHVPYGALFKGAYRSRTALLSAVWVFQTLGFYGFAAWVPTLLTKEGFSVVHSLAFTSVMTIGSPLGALMAIFMAERIDRKWFITADGVAIAVFGLLYGSSHTPGSIMLFGFLTVFFLQAFPTILSSYTPELYPTGMRSSGMGLTYGVGRLSNIIGPFIVSMLYVSLGYKTVFLYIAMCWLAAACIIGLFGPLTTRRSLEELSEIDWETAERVSDGRAPLDAK